MLYSRHYKGLNVYIAGVNLVKLSEVPPSLRALSHSLSKELVHIPISFTGHRLFSFTRIYYNVYYV